MKDSKTFFIIVASAAILIFAVLAVYLLGGQNQQLPLQTTSPATVEEQQELDALEIDNLDADLQSLDQDLQEL
ncbi:MAG: hypothetical protein HYY87_01445 [Candidatus Levybacteria bacterium]|nr:hypothetical protein [Candidatus Levybacteria bacterium]MBI3069953.1 hypothetical protein [Candidatus Levybacteria bacterium]